MLDKATTLDTITATISQRLNAVGGVLRRAGLTVTDNALVYALSLTESDYVYQRRTDLTPGEALERAIRILKARSPGVPTARLDAVAVVSLATEICMAYDVLSGRALHAEAAEAAPAPEEVHAAEPVPAEDPAPPVEPEPAPAPAADPKPKRDRRPKKDGQPVTEPDPA